MDSSVSSHPGQSSGPLAPVGGGRWVAEALGFTATEPLSLEDVALLDDLLSEGSLPAGSLVARAGAPADTVFLVRAGLIELRRDNGRRQVVIGTLAEGDVIGDVAMFLDRPHQFDAIAVTDLQVWAISSPDLLDLVARRSPVASRWLRSLAARVAESHERVGEVLAGHLDLRLAAVLLRRIGPSGRVDVTQAQLARLLGVQRSSINEAIRRLETRSLVSRGYGHVVVQDRSGLRLLLES